MITLHYSPSSASLVVHWLLLDLAIPHELRRMDLDAREHKQADYLAINPAGVVPTLVIDGQPICEAAAIVMHLADANPTARFAPEPGTLARAAYYRWMVFCANTLQPAYRAWFYPDEPAGAANAEASKQHARERIEAAWTIVDAHLATHGPYLLGNHVSAADFMLAMMMRWSRNMPRPADSWPAVKRCATLMKQRPSFAELYTREGLTDWT
jgi:glutathione S-transferase